MEEKAVSDYTLRYVGDQALLVEFENEISMEVNQKVRALKFDLEQKKVPGMGELVPTYRALLIHYDPLTADLNQLKEAIKTSAANMDLSQLPKAIVTEIPVLYEGEYALDLEEIARLENKTPEEIIKIHSGSDYYVYMLGFAPGHPYTARFENHFSFKRRETPRVRIPAPAGKEVTIRVILGPQDDMFTKEGLDTFLSQPYAVSKDFDRMGCRLEGPVIQHKADGNIISDGMVTGAIQVPTSGQPIIMLAELKAHLAQPQPARPAGRWCSARTRSKTT